jgi:hypothetical protein
LQLALLKQQPGIFSQICGQTRPPANELQLRHTGGIEAPADAVGATREITIGVKAAAAPSLRKTALLEALIDSPPAAYGSSKSFALDNCFSANQTVSSPTGFCHSFSIRVAISETDV